LGEVARQKGFEFLRDLRDMGIRSDIDYQGRSLNSQLKSADRLNAQFAVIIGDDELRNGLAIIKSMDEKTQEKVKFEEVLRRFK